MVCISCGRFALTGLRVNVIDGAGIVMLNSVICDTCVDREQSATNSVHVPIPFANPSIMYHVTFERYEPYKVQ